jgi:hypothetical protein
MIEDMYQGAYFIFQHVLVRTFNLPQDKRLALDVDYRFFPHVVPQNWPSTGSFTNSLQYSTNTLNCWISYPIYRKPLHLPEIGSTIHMLWEVHALATRTMITF